MDKGFLTKLLLCIGLCGFALYSYVDKQNALMRLRLEIPTVAKQLKELKEENTRLQYVVDLFESPEHLLELASYSEFGHLKHPMLKEIVTVQEGIALDASSIEEKDIFLPKPKLATSPLLSSSSQ